MLIMNIMEMMNPNSVNSKGDAGSSQNTSNNSFAKRLDDAVAGSATFKDTQNRVNNNKAEDKVKNSELNETEDSAEEKSEEKQYVPYVLIPVQQAEQPDVRQNEAISVIDGADAAVKIGTNEEQIINAGSQGQDVEITFDNQSELVQTQQAEQSVPVQNNEAVIEEQPKFTLLDTAVLKTAADINADQIENDTQAVPERGTEPLSAEETKNNAAEILNFFEKNTKEAAELTDNDFVRQVLDEANTQLKNDSVSEGYKALETSRPIIQNTEAKEHGQQNADDNSQQTAQQSKMSATEQNVNTAFSVNNNFEARLDSLSQAQANPSASQAQNVRFQILEQVSSMMSENRQELTLQLKPHHLGGLTITLTQDQNGVTAKLVTASKDAHMLIQSEMATMQETLRDKGIHVVEMEVIYDQMANTTGKGDSDTGYNPQNGGNSQRSGSNQGGLQMSTEEATWMYEEMTGIEVLAEQGGSVEFSA